jgi:hypothetical protein
VKGEELKLIKGRLKTARVHRDLTLSDVQELTNGEIKVSSLSSYERGLTIPSCEKVEFLAKLYEVPMSFLCFCPYFSGTVVSPTADSAGLGEEILPNPDETSLKVELTARELEILRKILEKVERNKAGLGELESTA